MRSRDILSYCLVIIPLASIPWPVQRLVTAVFFESQNGIIPWNIHIPPLVFWLIFTTISIRILRYNNRKK